jgi:hypothetical protein
LPHRLSDDLESADFTTPVHDFFIGQHGAQRRTPIDRHFRHVGKSAFKEFEENPLSPPIIIRIGRAQLPFPVVRQAGPFHLSFERGDILTRGNGRMDTGLDGILLGRKTERVPSHGMKHVVASHPFIARDDIGGGIALKMADMKPGSGRIGEHVQTVIFRPAQVLRGAEGMSLLPIGLPLGFNGVVVVGLTHVTIGSGGAGASSQ